MGLDHLGAIGRSVHVQTSAWRSVQAGEGGTVTLSLILACLWVIGAAIAAMFPSRDKHWKTAYVLASLGLPLWVFILYENGIWAGVATGVAGALVLRWPLIYFGRWLRRLVKGTSNGSA